MSKFNRRIWLLVVAFFFFGDIFTTGIGITSHSMTEGSPIYGPILESYGWVLMLFMLTVAKMIALGVAYAIWDRWDSDIVRYSIPLAFVLTGVIATVWNGFLIGMNLL